MAVEYDMGFIMGSVEIVGDAIEWMELEFNGDVLFGKEGDHAGLLIADVYWFFLYYF